MSRRCCCVGPSAHFQMRMGAEQSSGIQEDTCDFNYPPKFYHNSQMYSQTCLPSNKQTNNPMFHPSLAPELNCISKLTYALLSLTTAQCTTTKTIDGQLRYELIGVLKIKPCVCVCICLLSCIGLKKIKTLIPFVE